MALLPAEVVLRQHRESHVGDHSLATKLGEQNLPASLFRRVHRPWLEELPIRQLRETFGTALDADELLDVAPPWRNVLVPEGPVDCYAFLRVRLVVEIAPAEYTPAPHYRLSADLPAAYPRKRLPLRCRVRVVEIVDEKLARVFVAGAALGLNRLIALQAIAIAHAPVSFLVRHDVLDVIDSGIDRAARLEDNRLESVLGQLFCGPATGYSGADNDRIVIVWHFF